MAQQQLIKQLSATPTIPAQSTIDVAHDELDPQTVLRANKEVFFFRLVRHNVAHWVGIHTHSCLAQEREIEKVNAFYLQKEAEVFCPHSSKPVIRWWGSQLIFIAVFLAPKNIA